ncbi:hypothetical protein CO046_03730 [Candidatus Peregrinibacteria bacterium CG_4_9_14_0_2_um_filter_53_11]|nr:MAG: hypothetical protein CO046_03730 [Candidatus Peregrinibacteria bacterium CG_4_9_14_0_2_um_filter_53_11]
MVGVGAGAVSTVTLVDHGDPPAGTATESRRAGGEALGFDGPEEAGEAVDAESFGEKENQELLEKVEAGISDFYADLASLIEAVEDEGLKARLKGSFRVIKENENNPDKNWFTLVRHAREGGSVRYTNPNYFAYNFGRELPEEAKGGFAPQSRSLILNKNFHPQDLEGLIFLSNYYFPAGLTNFDLRSPFGRVLAENYRDSAEGEVYVLVGGRYVPYFQ